MDICFVPSLQQLTCTKIVTLLLNDPNVDLRWEISEENFYWNKFQITENISKLLPCHRLRAKLEHFISPILCEVENWAQFCGESWTTGHQIPLSVSDTVQQCWLSDGGIDREKSANILVKRSDISPVNRFIFACIFCMFHDVLNLWNILSNIEKAYLRHKYFTNNNSELIVKQWIEWFDNSTIQNWESFAAWTFQTALWKRNVYIMKHVLQTSSPLVKSHYLLEALREKNVSRDVKLFGLTIMSRDERQVIFTESPVEVFKCILYWPSRCIFIDLSDSLWSCVTADSFCSILGMILNMIKNETKDYVDLLVILKSFWAQSPGYCKKSAEKDSTISRPLDFVLKYDFAKQFSRRRFLNSFKPKYDHSMANRIPPFAEFLRIDLDEDY